MLFPSLCRGKFCDTHNNMLSEGTVLLCYFHLCAEVSFVILIITCSEATVLLCYFHLCAEVSFVILIITCSEATVLLCYFHLCAEES